MKTRTDRQIRERYLNYLAPNINKGIWTLEEDERLVYILSTNKSKSWKTFERFFPGRTDVSIKNRSKTMEIKQKISDIQIKNESVHSEFKIDWKNISLPKPSVFQKEINY
jgi:hypothetical protein